LFPLNGKEVAVTLPAPLAKNTYAIGFGPNGESLYFKTTDSLDRAAGIYKLEIQPPRASLVPGSVGLGQLWCLSFSESSSRLTVAGWSWTENRNGIFEIDPAAGIRQLLPPGFASRCGGSGGVASPNGGWAVITGGKNLRLADLKTGAVKSIKGTQGDMQVAWSPSGHLIACIRNHRITLVDLKDGSQPPRSLGSSGDGPIAWSPDSRYLLLRKSPILSCAFTPYGESLEVLDVESGRRTLVKAAGCTITGGMLGWMDRRLAQ
jgi:hypothetical protein